MPGRDRDLPARIPFRRRAHRGVGLPRGAHGDLDGILREHHRGALHRGGDRHPCRSALHATRPHMRACSARARASSLASLTAYLLGEFLNAFVLARLKVATRGRFLWTRTIGSTLRRPGSRQRRLHLARLRRDPAVVGAHRHHSRRVGREGAVRSDRNPDHLRHWSPRSSASRVWTRTTATRSSHRSRSHRCARGCAEREQ